MGNIVAKQACPVGSEISKMKTPVLSPRLTTSSGLLFHMDCLDLLKNVKNDSVHCIFADPPFNLGKDYNNGFDDARDDRYYINWCYKWIDECIRILIPGGAFFIYSLPRWAYLFAAHLEQRHMEFRHWIALTMKGTFPRGRKLYPAHYALLYFTKGTPLVFNKIRVPVATCRHCGGEIKDYGGHRKRLNPEGLNLTDFWEDTSPNRHSRFKARPGINELKSMIPERAIRIATDEGHIVFDPFGGGGSTFQEAERLGRYWLGSELGDCAAIEARMHELASLNLGMPPPDEVVSILDCKIEGR